VIAEGGYYNLGDHLVKPKNPTTLPRKIFLYSIAVSYWLQTGINPWYVNPIDDLSAVKPRPIMFIYGEQELNAGQGDLQYAAAQEPKDLWVVPRGNHGTNHITSPEEYQARVLRFFQSTIVNP
jgi:fermentation-respiration switch protein FrsA (DUF1100 family)